ncbi:MAG: HD domain-containing phosphohydrolase [Eubacteriales bacterium]
MENLLSKDVYLPLLNTVGDLLELSDFVLYLSDSDDKELYLKETIKNQSKFSMPHVVEYKYEDLIINEIGLKYAVKSCDNGFHMIYVPLYLEKKLIGLLAWVNHKPVKQNQFDMIYKYLLHLYQNIQYSTVNPPPKFIELLVDHKNTVVDVIGDINEMVFINNEFLNKSIHEVYPSKIAKELIYLIQKSLMYNKIYSYILDIYFSNEKIRLQAEINRKDLQLVGISLYYTNLKESNVDKQLKYKLQIYLNYAIKRLLSDKHGNVSSILKEIINGLGISNAVDHAHISLFNENDENVLFYTWSKKEKNKLDSFFHHYKIDKLFQSYHKPIILSYPNTNNLEDWGIDVNFLLGEGVQSFMLVTLGQWEKYFGFIVLQNTRSTMCWSGEQRHCLTVLSQIITNIISCYDEKSQLRYKYPPYDTLAEKSRDLLIRFDNNYKIIYFNNTVEKYQLSKVSLIGKVIFDEEITGKIFLDKYIDYLHYIQVSKQDYEISFYTNYGKFYRVRIVPEISELGKFETGMIILSDLTEYMNIAKLKDDNEEKLKLAIEASNIVIWDINIKYGKISYSGNLEELLKYQLKDNVDVKDIMKPHDYTKLKRDICTYIKEVRSETNKKFCKEIKVRNTQGQYKWFLIRGKITRWDGDKPLNIMGTAMDVTESKKREKQIKFLAEHDYLTNLYNRNYFEASFNTLDVKFNYPIGIIIIDVDGLKIINDAFGHEMGDNLIKCTGKVLSNTFQKRQCIVSRIGGDEFAVLVTKTNQQELEFYSKTINYLLKDENIISVTPSVSIGYALKIQPHTNISSVFKSAEDMMYKSKLLKSTSTRSTIIKSLQKALQERTHETEEHCNRIKFLAIKVAGRMSLSDSLMDDVILLSNLHDIGKIAIPDNILNKPGKLSKDEWTIMKTHCEIGYRIASSTWDIYSIAEGILSHHEGWDGNGYPRGLKEDEIPLISRIISVIDAFDAMTHDRVYRKALTKEDAIKEIKKNSGTQFDPKVVIQFNEVVENTKEL